MVGFSQYLFSVAIFMDGVHSDVHVARMTPIERQREMAALSLITIIAVVEYGKCRADHIFVD